MIKKIILTLFLFFFVCAFSWAEDIYYPYPIIFVHGIASKEAMWDKVRHDLDDYFKDGMTNQGLELYKYPYQSSDGQFFPWCDYEISRVGEDTGHNGDIAEIARLVLAASIDKALKAYPPNVPEDQRKVIIVVHSMGGLVVRSLLKQDVSGHYKGKIDRVVFIDTPHLGSPFASILWIFNEIKKDSKNSYKDTKYNSYSAFSPFLSYLDSVMPTFDNMWVNAKINNTEANINLLLFLLEHSPLPHPSSTAISQMRTPAFSYYETIYSGFLYNSTIYKSYAKTDTFLGNDNVTDPEKYKVIIGKNDFPEPVFWGIKSLMNFDGPFHFATLKNEVQSLDNAVFVGDGVVTKSSQEGIGAGGHDYEVQGFHVGVADKCSSQIIDVIDDKPVIEAIYAISADKSVYGPTCSVYVVAKIKDYLLADVEIFSATLNGMPINLEEFNDGNGHYKPYFKFGKNFLKERPDVNLLDKDYNIITLKPGEFYVNTTLDVSLAHTILLKIKNPAGKKTETSITLNKPIIDSEFPVSTTDNRMPNIGARIYSPDGIDINLDSIYMTLDSQSVDCSVSPSQGGANISLMHSPTSFLDFGSHSVSLRARDIIGLEVSKDWTFTVLNSNTFFEVNVPSSISRDTNFTMTVTAKDIYGNVMTNYNENASITISGDPNPTGQMTISNINQGQWVSGVWATAQQRYINGNESKYRMTVTITNLSPMYQNMTGSADTIVEPLNLQLKEIGGWDINIDTGDWEGGPQAGVEGFIQDILACGSKYEEEERKSPPFESYYFKKGYYPCLFSGFPYMQHNAACVYKIEVPGEVNVDILELHLRRRPDIVSPYPTEDNSKSFQTFKQILYNWMEYGDITPIAYPLDIAAEAKIDYSYTSPIGRSTPIGEYNLIYDFIGGRTHTFSGDGPLPYYGPYYGHSREIKSSPLPKTFIQLLPVPSQTKTIWISVYIDNIKAMVSQIEPHARSILVKPETGRYFWGIYTHALYYVDAIYGYKK